MTDLIGWAIYAFAQAGEWLLLPAAIAAGWASYRITRRALLRPAAVRAEAAARPSTDPLEQLYHLPAATRRNTRKENRP